MTTKEQRAKFEAHYRKRNSIPDSTPSHMLWCHVHVHFEFNGWQAAIASQREAMLKAIALYEAALIVAYPEGADGEAFSHWNAARQALDAMNSEKGKYDET